MTKTIQYLTALCICIPLLANQCSIGDTDSPILIPIHDWSSQNVSAHVIGEILKHQGYTVSFKRSDVPTMFEKIRNGDFTFENESWAYLYLNEINQAMSQGGIVSAGQHQAKAEEGWWVSSEAILHCPDLPKWKALNSCHALFAQPTTGSDKGVYHSASKTWRTTSNDNIKRYNLYFVEQPLKSAAEQAEFITTAKQNKKPIAIYNWQPSWVDQHRGQFVRFPNSKKTPIYKFAWHKMSEKWPCAFRTINMISFSQHDFEKMAKLVDIEQLTPRDAAVKWMAENESTWKKWL